MATIEITTGISTTKKSAQSKKCRLLAKVAARTVNYKVALAIRSVDPLLADVMSEAEVRSAWDTGLRKRSSAGGSKSSSAIKLTIEIDDDEPESDAALEFWMQQYASGVPTFELPLDRARPAVKTYPADRRVLELDSTLYQSVRRCAAQQGATPFVMLLAVFEVLVSRLAAVDELIEMTMSAPAWAIASAMPRPMPPLPPVTSATLPVRSKGL